ncbi:hypothetical protein ACYKOU_01965 [Streptococcus suis]|uniref:hypothetical protein n=2 Tax=Streptococcus suis TaxID=1307 RepID=UPI000462953C|nr:hypothetical protein [Streptococcus suis]MBS8078825.1 hypothetical protein [Streptococcus suis]MCK3965274.1 hypothetical protein [Streptococcus suis]HEL1708518.1 hypothetical protein [Streptococcus suis]HEL1776825.1 hypothetical protein [Streptococcus suis]HEL1838119.1 hypothetical protein [Streptococcus suis]
MLKSKTFKNILFLVNIYIKDSLKGLSQHSLFETKRNRWIIAMSGIIGYLFYFYLNVVEFAKLSKFGQNYSFDELKSTISISIASYNNLAIIAGILIFLLINATVHLQSSSLFLSKVLPYNEKEVFLSVKLFKLGLGTLCFELFFIILIPGLGILRSPLIAILLFLSCHLIFWASYLFANFLYILSLRHLPLSDKHIHNLIYVSYFLVGLSYLFLFRFKVEFFLAQAIDSPQLLSLLILIGSMLAMSLLLRFDRVHYDVVFLQPRFTLLPFTIFNSLLKGVPLAIIRTKLFLYSFLFIVFIGVYSTFVANLEVAAYNLLDFWPMLGLAFLNYADSTLDHRKLYRHLRIDTRSEVIRLVLTAVLIHLPSLLFACYVQENYLVFLSGISLSITSLMVGFLFPRSVSSSNETLAFMLLLLAVPIVYLLIKVPILLVPTILVLILTLSYIIKKETEVHL